MPANERIVVVKKRNAHVRKQLLLCGVTCVVAMAALGLTYSHFSTPSEPVLAEITPSTETPAAPGVHSPALALPAAISLRVGSGDTLISMLTDTGVSPEEAHEAVAAIRKIYDPRKLSAGSQVAVNLDASEENPAEPVISSLTMPVSKIATVELVRSADGDFEVKKVEEPTFKKVAAVKGVINSSFYVTGNKLGIPANVLNDLIKAFSYDVDFQRDIKKGHTLSVVMERMETKSGIVASTGTLMYASLGLGKRTLNLYRYTDKNGRTDYYNEKGESLRKALLRTPINGAKITSGFGMRMHPLLGYSKMHRGVDFGAAPGTPIYAAGDGVVEMAGWNAGYGNYVRIKHDKKYSTAYGHASRIASGIKPGKKVKQGQVIAYVGSTGQSTGPHLHYEILASGSQVNPSGVKFKTGNTLSGKELAAFKQNVVKQVQAALGNTKESTVASTETPQKTKKN